MLFVATKPSKFVKLDMDYIKNATDRITPLYTQKIFPVGLFSLPCFKVEHSRSGKVVFDTASVELRWSYAEQGVPRGLMLIKQNSCLGETLASTEKTRGLILPFVFD